MQLYTVYIWKLLYMFRLVPPPIIRSAHNCIYSICYLSDRYCYLPLSRQVAVTVWQIPDAVDTVVCAPDVGWKYHSKYVEQFPDINKLCNFASCWIYEYIGILLGVHRILHISRIRVKRGETFIKRKLRRINTFLPFLKLVSKKTSWSNLHFEKKYFCIPRSFLAINICDQGKTLCSPCILFFDC